MRSVSGLRFWTGAARRLAAVSVSMPKMRFEGDSHKKKLIESVRATAAEISKGLGKRPEPDGAVGSPASAAAAGI